VDTVYVLSLLPWHFQLFRIHVGQGLDRQDFCHFLEQDMPVMPGLLATWYGLWTLGQLGRMPGSAGDHGISISACLLNGNSGGIFFILDLCNKKKKKKEKKKKKKKKKEKKKKKRREEKKAAWAFQLCVRYAIFCV